MALYYPEKTNDFEYLVKKSRFIAFLYSVYKEDDISKIYDELKTANPKANHVCYAFRIFDEKETIVYRFSDDGEPTGSAGKPIYNHIEGNGLINSAVFVVRYFGGIKLGVGGLVKAYGHSAKEVISSATLLEFVRFQMLKLSIDYSELQKLEYLLPQYNAAIIEKEFTDIVDLTVKIPEEVVKEFSTLYKDNIVG